MVQGRVSVECQGEENGVWLMNSDRFANRLIEGEYNKRNTDTFQQFYAQTEFSLIPAPLGFNLISPCMTHALLKLLPPC